MNHNNTQKAYIESIFKNMDLKVEKEVFDFVLSLSKDYNDIQTAVSRLKAHSDLWAMDINLDVAKKVLLENIFKKQVSNNLTNLMNIEDITFKYMFNDKDSQYNGQYFNYVLVDDTVSYSNENIILFKVESQDKQEVYEIKLIYRDNFFYIMSEYLDADCTEFEVEFFKNDSKLIFYKNFYDGELYLHIEFS